ncbi:probable methyltransferase PMT23 [Lycium barbarum]|uniref:probable methyltransferase PMT23 n=1 Tax=Lycium barbarum TaxID=112863 RepID=UPI00293E3469|nr:probable methyltransferase PMT23 [Lycium barbarum]
MAISSSSSSSMQDIFKQRKYPFIFSFFLLLIFVTFLLISNSQKSPIFVAIDFAQSTAQSKSIIPEFNNNRNTSSTSTPPLHQSNEIDNTTINPDSSNAPLNNFTIVPESSTVPLNNFTIDPESSTVPLNNFTMDPESSNAPLNNVTIKHENDTMIKNDGLETFSYDWKLCPGPVAVDYIPCLDNWQAIKKIRSRRHMEHRERHCPVPSPRCLIPLPVGYKLPVAWPKSRDMIWYNNVPHPKLVEYKKDQNWVKKYGNYFVFPGGGTQFKDGVNHYIEFIEETFPTIEWGKSIRVVLDVGCGVASFGGYLLDKNVITMSFAPKDEHEAQIQFALERGIPATLSVIATKKLAFPDNAYDMIHCARCRVHWHADGGKPLMELNRILRPGGYFIWSATPVYKKDEGHKNVWKVMVNLTEAMCWKMVARTYFKRARVGLVIYQKPDTSSCYENRKVNNPPMCEQKHRLNSSWYTPLDSCLLPIPPSSYKWPAPWPQRLNDKPLSLSVETDAEEIFNEDTSHWAALVSDVYLGGLAINWSTVRNVMDMNAGYGGFATALIDRPLWVMNVVPISGPDTLPIIFDRGLVGTYHDWCESFNTYPRTYDLLHSSFLFGNLSQRCDLVEVAVEMDRMVRPGGYVLVQDAIQMIKQLGSILRSLHWSVTLHQEQFLVGKKDFWRPKDTARE